MTTAITTPIFAIPTLDADRLDRAARTEAS
jgi:hypothetical protein